MLAAPRRILQAAGNALKAVEIVQHGRRMHAEPPAAKAQLLGNDGKRPPLGAQPTAFQRGVQPYDPDVLHRLNAGEPRLQRACTFQHGCQAPIGLGVGGAEPRRCPTTQRRITRSPQNRPHRSIDRRQIDAHRVRMTGLRGKPFQDQWIVPGDDVVGAVGEAFQYLESL